MARKAKARKTRARKSRRGGASAPAKCRSSLSSCMTKVIRDGGTFKTAGKKCMKAFNACRR